jgi:hypothetical protein
MVRRDEQGFHRRTAHLELPDHEVRTVSGQETRYIIMGVCGLFDGIRKQHNGRNYVETPLPLSDPGNITEIIVGPDAPPDAEALVTGLLNRFGYPPRISVFRSGC